MYQKILVVLDGSTLAECVLGQVEQIAKLMGAEICLLRVAHATTFPGVDPTDVEVQAVEEAQNYLQGVADRLQQQGFNATVHVRFGDPAEEILEHAKKIDLLAMSTHGRTGWGRWLMGSIADRVIRHSPVPVLLCPAAAYCALEKPLE